MKTVAFLQNMWVYPRSVASVTRFGPLTDERERMIAYALFAGCLTGRRLRAALGDDLCEEIIWQEANPTIADNPKDYYPPVPEHIRAVLEKHHPDLVICFARQAIKAVEAECERLGIRFVASIHPAARGEDTLRLLADARKQLEAA